MPKILEATKERVLLGDVSWDAYRCLLADAERNAGSRLTFDRGVLEISSPHARHERRNRHLNLLVEILAEEWEVDLEAVGSLTLSREDLHRALEPDSCFYVGSVGRVADFENIRVENGDPPPDLVIEVDVTSPSLDKLPLYAELGVPEIWRQTGDAVSILVRDGAGYVEADASPAFPRLTAADLNRLFAASRTERHRDWVRGARAWARGLEGGTGGDG
jgi:Uma2 family endonuclease